MGNYFRKIKRSHLYKNNCIYKIQWIKRGKNIKEHTEHQYRYKEFKTIGKNSVRAESLL
jgi:hypothetical protein